MVAKLCLFHALCLGTAARGEHVLQAALGGRRTSGKLICANCQSRFGCDLDEELPRQLRLFNTMLGVVGDHSGPEPVMTPMDDRVAGRRVLLDENFNFHSREHTLKRGRLPLHGVRFMRYSVIGERGQQRALDKLKSGLPPFDLYREERRHFIQPDALISDLEFGGERAFRAVGRLVLNVLGTLDADVARHPGLAGFKRWIYSGDQDPAFCQFAEPMLQDLPPPPRFEAGHRVWLAFHPSGNLEARVSFFDALDVALHLGDVGDRAEKIWLVELDPLATYAAPGVDVHVSEVTCADYLLYIGRPLTDQDAFLNRFEMRARGVAADAERRVLLRMLAEPVEHMNFARRIADRSRRLAIIREALLPLTQVAYNIWSWAASLYRRELAAAGCAVSVSALDALPNSPAEHELRAGAVLTALAVIFDSYLEGRRLTAAVAVAVLDGPHLRHLAVEAVRIEMGARRVLQVAR